MLIHEIGHFLFAKLFHVKILEFGIGMGPRLFSRKSKSGIEFRINLFPIGGFVKMAGEEPNDTNRSDPKESAMLFSNKPAWQRFFVAFSGPMFSILGGYLLLALSTMVWGLPAISIDRVDIHSPAYVSGLRSGDQITHINGRRVLEQADFSNAVQSFDHFSITVHREGTGSIDMTINPAAFPKQVSLILETSKPFMERSGDRVQRISGIPINEWLLSDPNQWVDRDIILEMEDGQFIEARLRGLQHVEPRKAVGIVYASISNRFRAAALPFEADDILVSVNGIPIETGVHTSYAFLLLTNARSNEAYLSYIEIRGDTLIDSLTIPSKQEATFGVLREGQFVTIQIPLDQMEPVFQTAIFYPAMDNWFPDHVVQALGLGFQRANHLLYMMGSVLRDLFQGRTGAGEFIGVIGLTGIVGQAARAGMETMIFLVAFITLNLGLINLLPLPALDGGRIVFAVIEMVFRRKVNPTIEGYIHAVGFFLLMGLIVFITYNDIMRFIR